ncbi:hypothetical protein ACET3Z_014158 [Daucus carota]
MMKSDHHTKKVRDGFWQKKEGSRKQRREGRLERTKRCQKQSRLRNKKKRAKEKKNEIESVKKWRKQRQQSGFPRDGKDFDIGLSFEDGNIIVSLNRKKPAVHPGDRLEARHDKVLEGVNQEPYKKIMGREFKESKYGFGGKKARRSKILLRQLTNDMRITLLGKREVTELWKSEVKESLENKTTEDEEQGRKTLREFCQFYIKNLETGKKRSYNEFGESLPTLMEKSGQTVTLVQGSWFTTPTPADKTNQKLSLKTSFRYKPSFLGF